MVDALWFYPLFAFIAGAGGITAKEKCKAYQNRHKEITYKPIYRDSDTPLNRLTDAEAEVLEEGFNLLRAMFVHGCLDDQRNTYSNFAVMTYDQTLRSASVSTCSDVKNEKPQKWTDVPTVSSVDKGSFMFLEIMDPENFQAFMTELMFLAFKGPISNNLYDPISATGWIYIDNPNVIKFACYRFLCGGRQYLRCDQHPQYPLPKHPPATPGNPCQQDADCTTVSFVLRFTCNTEYGLCVPHTRSLLQRTSASPLPPASSMTPKPMISKSDEANSNTTVIESGSLAVTISSGFMVLSIIILYL